MVSALALEQLFPNSGDRTGPVFTEKIIFVEISFCSETYSAYIPSWDLSKSKGAMVILSWVYRFLQYIGLFMQRTVHSNIRRFRPLGHPARPKALPARPGAWGQRPGWLSGPKAWLAGPEAKQDAKNYRKKERYRKIDPGSPTTSLFFSPFPSLLPYLCFN